MIRRAFTMRLKPGALAEYKYHHDNIWPELVAEIEKSGIGSITTFQRDLDLFLISEINDPEAWDKLWNSPVHRRWGEVMQPLMHLRDDGIVDAGELTEIFHLTIHGNRNGHAQHISLLSDPVREPTIDDLLQQSDALWREPGVQAAVASGPSGDPSGRALARGRKKATRRIKKRAVKAAKKKTTPKKSAKKLQRKGRAKPAKATASKKRTKSRR